MLLIEIWNDIFYGNWVSWRVTKEHQGWRGQDTRRHRPTSRGMSLLCCMPDVSLEHQCKLRDKLLQNSALANNVVHSDGLKVSLIHPILQWTIIQQVRN